MIQAARNCTPQSLLLCRFDLGPAGLLEVRQLLFAAALIVSFFAGPGQETRCTDRTTKGAGAGGSEPQDRAALLGVARAWLMGILVDGLVEPN